MMQDWIRGFMHLFFCLFIRNLEYILAVCLNNNTTIKWVICNYSSVTYEIIKWFFDRKDRNLYKWNQRKKYTGGKFFLLVWKLEDNSQRKFSYQIMSLWAYFLVDSTEDFRIDHNTKSNTTRLSQKSCIMVISKLFPHLFFF